MTIKALVAVRAGSVRVRNKNIRPFADSSLLEIKLRQLKRLSCLDGILVSSEDDRMLEMAERLGAKAMKREDRYASSTVCMSQVYAYMARQADADLLVYANVTNPLLKDETVEEAVRLFQKYQGEYDSVNTVHPIKEFLWKEGKPWNYDPARQPKSQDLPEIYALNFAVSVLSRETMIQCENVVGKRPWLMPIDYEEATDIDDEIDFKIAEYLYKEKKGLLC